MRRTRTLRRRLQGNRTVLGALVVAVMLGAVDISYHADSGLPLRPAYHLTVEVPDAAQLHPGDQVRIGGARVGTVRALEAASIASPRARIWLTIPGHRRLPVDSTVTIRPLSILGAKSVQLTPGRSKRTVPDGGLLPLTRARPTVDLNDALSAFDARTRAGLRGTLGGLAGGVAGRGTSVNELLGALAPLLAPARRVADTLVVPQTHLARLIASGDAFFAALVPVAAELPDALSGAGTTFGALADPRARLAGLLTTLPGTEADTTHTLRVAAPVLRDAAALTAALRPAAAHVGATATRLDALLRAGTPRLAQAATLSLGLGRLARAVRLTVPPRAGGLADSLTGLSTTVRAVRAATDALGPAQEACNALALSIRNSTAVISDGDAEGSWFSFITLLSPFITPTGSLSDDTHVNAHPIEDARGCAAGNTPYLPGRHEGNPAVLSTAHENSPPPASATARAAAAGLLSPVPGSRVP